MSVGDIQSINVASVDGCTHYPAARAADGLQMGLERLELNWTELHCALYLLVSTGVVKWIEFNLPLFHFITFHSQCNPLQSNPIQYNGVQGSAKHCNSIQLDVKLIANGLQYRKVGPRRQALAHTQLHPYPSAGSNQCCGRWHRAGFQTASRA